MGGGIYLKKRILLIISSLILCSSLDAWEPPRQTLGFALLNGMSAFIGRVVNIKEIKYLKKTDNNYFPIIQMEARVKILNKLYGMEKAPKKHIKIRFYKEYPSDDSPPAIVPTQFYAGGTYIITTRKQISKRTIDFDSDLWGGIDNAYLINNFDYNVFKENEKMTLKSCYYDIESEIIYGDIDKFVSKRDDPKYNTKKILSRIKDISRTIWKNEKQFKGNKIEVYILKYSGMYAGMGYNLKYVDTRDILIKFSDEWCTYKVILRGEDMGDLLETAKYRKLAYEPNKWNELPEEISNKLKEKDKYYKLVVNK